MQTYLGLGSNLGDRRENLRRAIALLEQESIATRRVSPVVESPALLPDAAPEAWNLPYLNLVLDCDVSLSPERLGTVIKRIERSMGRESAKHWSPRPIDIDILLWGQSEIHSDALTIPHPGTHKRSFALTPLVALQPRLQLAAENSRKTVLDWASEVPDHIPLWMGIINVTPDSFSDGGRFMEWSSIEPEITSMVEAGVHIIDVGAESTRPGASVLSADVEWARLEPVLEALLASKGTDRLFPQISVDTYHPATAQRALALGVDIINDVTGLTNPQMLDLAQGGGADWIAMHSLGIPADPERIFSPGTDPVAAVEQWLMERLDAWTRAGLDLNRIVFDPGIGFGKDALQSLKLLRAAGRFRQYGLRVLIGHSRKSFLRSITNPALAARDLATVGASLSLCQQRVDILRVHNVAVHTAAYRGWMHAQPVTGTGS